MPAPTTGNDSRLFAFSERAGRGSEQFADPFCDMASLAMPDTIQDALRWCEYILMANGPYREALNRVISYFITDVKIQGQGDRRIGPEEKRKYEDFLNDTIGIKTVLHTVALDYLCYGNSFTSLIVPFRRYLACPSCGLELPLKKVFNTPEFGFTWSSFNFHANCPHCQYTGNWRHIDRRAGEQGQIKVKRWSPHEMDILWDPETDDTAFIWKIPDDYRNLLRRGKLFHLERASWEIIEAVRDNQALMFDKDVVYHMAEQALSGVRNRGWGISRVLTNFRQAWYVQVLHRYNEAIALDYVIPFRVLTPMPRPSGGDGATGDPVLSINMGNFTSRVNAMLRDRKRDPARWNILPFPIDYKALGGDATELAPKDLLELGMNTLLNAIGVPVELYNGSLGTQAAPAALRLFEANWSHLIHNLNRFLRKLTDKVSQVMGWEPVTCTLERVTHADDLNRQMAILQLMMGGQVSRTTGLGSVGADFLEETRRKLEEERIEAEETAEMQKEMDQAAQMDAMAQPQDPAAMMGGAGGQMQGAPGAAGAPPPQAMQGGQDPAAAQQQFAMQQPMQPNQPTTPEEMQARASQIAAMVQTYPPSQRQSFLIQLDKQDPTTHALVVSQLEEIERQAQSMAAQQIQQQQFGKQARSILLDD